MTRELLLQALEALEGVAPDDPMNQDEMGGCVWCGGPGGYVAATGDQKDHDATCAWVIARKQIASIRAHLAKPQSEPETCKWTADEDGMWESSCCATWEFHSGGPVENGFHFCHSCGKPVEIVGAS